MDRGVPKNTPHLNFVILEKEKGFVMNRRMMYVLLVAFEILAVAIGYYFGGWKGAAIAIAASGAGLLLRWLVVAYRHRVRLPPLRSLDNILLSFPSDVSLVVGVVVDLIFAYVFVILILFAAGIYLPWPAIAIIVVSIATLKYLWSVDLFQSKVETYQMGTVTYLERIIPSGPNGSGLLPGYYWLPLGRPIYKVDFTESTQEITIDFDQMQVWAANSPTRGQGAVNGEIDGNAQFEVTDPGLYKSVEQPLVVLKAIVEEAARDVCERLTIEEFIETRNDELAGDIVRQINATLEARLRQLGVRLNSVNVTRTDNKSEEVKRGWDQVNVQRSLATARNTDAANRIRRIRNYKAAGIDANRAIAADLVASDKTGANVGDQRYNADVGESLKNLGEGILNKFGGTQ